MRKPSVDRTQGASVEDVFASSIEGLRAIPLEARCARGCGEEWAVHPELGKGGLWRLSVEGIAAVSVLDVTFAKRVDFDVRAPAFYCLGVHERTNVLDVPAGGDSAMLRERPRQGTLLGYAWREGSLRETFFAGERLSVSSVHLLPEALAAVANIVGSCPVELASAIAFLDGTRPVPALSRLFAGMASARLDPGVAEAYYRCKLTEACLLAVDWFKRTDPGPSSTMGAEDRNSLNVVRGWARSHLGEDIGMDDLCRVACMSSTKLSALFKAAEGTTPMGWVREQRMSLACALLASSDERLGAIAAKVGFSKQGSFSEAFKNKFGMTPNAYRAIARRRAAEGLDAPFLDGAFAPGS